MAQLSLGDTTWRMVRRVLKKRRFTFEDCRGMNRKEREHFDWLVTGGFFAPLGDGQFAVTDRGREAADLGMYEWEPAAHRK